VHPENTALPYDHALFAELRRALVAGELSRERARLATPPSPLAFDDPRLVRVTAGTQGERRAAGEASLRAGEVATLILNGGLATRFGGLVKGVVPVLGEDPKRSFLALKLGAVRATAERLGQAIPAVVMCSFATRSASDEHLAMIEWAGVPVADRLTFDQSVLPRIDPDGGLLRDRPGAETMPQSALYAAPGHGDTLEQALRSGLVDRLRARGIRHVLVSNVDNLGATIDPHVLGQHLAAVDRGAAASVEVVRRRPGDVGGCIAEVGGRPVIVEGFRLPTSTDPERYAHFNTNTLWLTLDALGSMPPLTYFPVARKLRWSDGADVDLIQFERLIGQITEHLPAAYVEVDRDERFVPIKTRDDLAAARPWIEAHLSEFGAP